MKKRILFVDDETRVLSAIRRMVHGMRDSWDVEFVTDGDLALQCLKAGPYDAIVSDLRMGAMDGLTLLEKARVARPGILRFVLSAFAPRLTVFGVMKVAHRFIVKPCESEVLIGVLSRCFELMDSAPGEFRRILEFGVPTVRGETVDRLRELLKDDDVNAGAMERLVMNDAPLAALLLHYATFTLVDAADSDRRLYQALSSVTPLEIRELLDQGIIRSGQDAALSETMAHSAATARHAAARIGDDLPVSSLASEAYLAGLLHDIGIWVLMAGYGASYAEMLRSFAGDREALAAAEVGAYGVSHAELGAGLLGIWGLPAGFVDAVANHHVPSPSEGGGDLRSAVRAAELDAWAGRR